MAALAASFLLLSCNSLTAFAEVTLPEGAVKGLPERLAALDDAGNAVNSATGEYFFRVEDMDYGVTYTKDVQIMNLRDDFAYYIYFYVEPLYKKGEIDLEKGCECRFLLDGKEFYRGNVNGEGNIDLSETYYSLGYYKPGDSHVLRAEITWNEVDVIQNVDNGHRLVDKDGTHVLVGPGESGHAEGEIEFKWIFFASVQEETTRATTATTNDETKDSQTTTTATGGDETNDSQVTTATTGDETKDSRSTTTATTGDESRHSQETTSPTDSRHSETVVTTTPPPTEVENQTDGTTTAIGGGTDTTPGGSDSTIPGGTTTVTTVTETTENSGFPGISTPFTGYLAKDGTFWLVCIGGVSAGIVVLLFLMLREKRKKK